MKMNDIVNSLTPYEKLLKEVDYKNLYPKGTYPTDFALKFKLFISLVNDGLGEENLTPDIHMKMLDKLAFVKRESQVNVCFRGSSKTTLFCVYLPFYLSIYRFIGKIKELGDMILVFNSADNGAKTARESLESMYYNSKFLQEMLPVSSFTDSKIVFKNKDNKKFVIKLLGYQQPIRGTRNANKRPKFIIIDDVFTDKSGDSEATRELVQKYMNKAVRFAMHPTEHVLIYNATPFRQDDLAIDYVNSGLWNSSVFPVCSKFPCKEEDFDPAWGDRFDYSYVKEQYDMLSSSSKNVQEFRQELMLEVVSEDNRQVKDYMINWYDRKNLLRFKENYNFYVFSDYSFSKNKTSDFGSVILVALNNAGQYFLVDIFARRGVGSAKCNDVLFDFAFKYKTIKAAGIEINGQQEAVLNSVKLEMTIRNQYFTIGRDIVTREQGIKSTGTKFDRFKNNALPLFIHDMIFFPDDLLDSPDLKELLDQVKNVTTSGIKGADDCLDCLSQIKMMITVKPNSSQDNTDEKPKSKNPLLSPFYQEEETNEKSGIHLLIN